MKLATGHTDCKTLSTKSGFWLCGLYNWMYVWPVFRPNQRLPLLLWQVSSLRKRNTKKALVAISITC